MVIICTGPSASGKTYLSKKIKEKLNIEILSVDNYKEKIWDENGFVNEIEKEKLSDKAKEEFIKDVFYHIKYKKDLIIEYPFDNGKEIWINLFDELDKITKICFINVKPLTFELFLENNINRKTDVTRHIGHSSKKYINNKKIESTKDFTKEELLKKYNSKQYIWNKNHYIEYNWTNLEEIIEFIKKIKNT